MNDIICACGCGRVIPPKPFHRRRGPKYINGHNPKNLKGPPVPRLTPPEGWTCPSGLCECGCGQRTPIAATSRPKYGQYAGYPIRYIRGHNTTGKRAQGWKGGRKRDVHGYWWLYRPEHPNATKRGYVREHRIVWEETHGRLLQRSEDVHHIDGNKGNNAPENLVALTKADHRRTHYADEAWAKNVSDKVRSHYAKPENKAKLREAIKRGWETRRAKTKVHPSA